MLQIRGIRKPGLARLLTKLSNYQEGFDANQPDYLTNLRAAFGENFCAAGQVVLGSYEDVESAILNPQAREFKLGTSYLDATHLPSGKLKGGPDRNLFVSPLS